LLFSANDDKTDNPKQERLIMPKAKRKIKVRDQHPSKDVKGGGSTQRRHSRRIQGGGGATQGGGGATQGGGISQG
jgi:hypothetical protein